MPLNICFSRSDFLPRKIEYTVPEDYDGIKAVTFLRSKCGVSSRLVGKLKKQEDGILLNGERIRTIDKLKAGAKLEINIPDEGDVPEPVSAPLDIIYEDSDILVINKSPFTAMHPTHNHQGDTLANAVAAYLLEKGQGGSFRAVGRLDKGTSGVVVCALNRLSASKLNGKIKKEYLALVQGTLSGSGVIDVPIYRPDPMKTLRACSYEKGVETAVTNWTAVENFENASLIRLNLETGRTHQIRVHMAHTGHPLAGDSYYGSFMTQYRHQLLHCEKCSFSRPVTDEYGEFTAPLPDDFRSALSELRNGGI